MKTMKEQPISSQQLKAIHATFRHLGFDNDECHGFVFQFTEGRTNSTKELTFDEARRMLTSLNGEDLSEEGRELVGDIYGLSLRISFLNRDYQSDDEDERQMNYAKLNVFCRNYSRFHKNLTAMKLAELKEVKKQLEAIARKEND